MCTLLLFLSLHLITTVNSLHLHHSHPETFLSFLPNTAFTTQNFTSITTPLLLPPVPDANETAWTLLPVGCSPHLFGGVPGKQLQLWRLQPSGWESIPISGGTARAEQAGFSDDRNTTYLFGGKSGGVYSAELQMITTDSGNVSTSNAWGSGDNAWVRATAGSTLTLLPGGRHALLLGGFASETAYIGFSQVVIYNLDQGTWEPRSTALKNGVKIQPRTEHSAVVDARGRMLVFGGRTAEDVAAEPKLVALNMTTWEWEVPEQGEVKGMWGHAAKMLMGDVMLVTDGDGVGLFNATSDVWVEEYRPPIQEYPVKGPRLNAPALAAGLVVGIVTAAVIVVLGMAMCKSRRRFQEVMTKDDDEDEFKCKARSPTPSSSETQAASVLSLSFQQQRITLEEDEDEKGEPALASVAPTHPRQSPSSSSSSSTLLPALLERVNTSPELHSQQQQQQQPRCASVPRTRGRLRRRDAMHFNDNEESEGVRVAIQAIEAMSVKVVDIGPATRDGEEEEEESYETADENETRSRSYEYWGV